jgi:hypothetical protein
VRADALWDQCVCWDRHPGLVWVTASTCPREVKFQQEGRGRRGKAGVVARLSSWSEWAVFATDPV